MESRVIKDLERCHRQGKERNTDSFTNHCRLGNDAAAGFLGHARRKQILSPMTKLKIKSPTLSYIW